MLYKIIDFKNFVASSLTFMETCSFEFNNVCGMIQSSEDNAEWQRITQASSGPQADHTYAGTYQGNI